MKSLILISIIAISVLMNSCEKDLNNFYSSNGDSLILFISRRTENSPNWHLFRMNLDGTEQTRISELTVKYNKPVVSHSGKKVLFVHYTEDYYYELYLINIDGTNLALVDRADRYCGSPVWSADDSKIIYSRNRNDSTDDKDIILYELISGNKNILTSSFNNIPAKFSNNGKIIYSQQDNTLNDIYSMNVDGSDKKMIISKGISPVLSPDYKKIAYISVYTARSPQINVANIDGSHSIQLTYEYLPCWDSGYGGFGNSNPRWTPDGKKIVYVSEINDGEAEIYIMDSDGSNKIRLTNTDGHNESPVVSSDGKFIVFPSSRDLNRNSDIYVMDIYGKNQIPLSKYPGDDCCPVIAVK